MSTVHTTERRVSVFSIYLFLTTEWTASACSINHQMRDCIRVSRFGRFTSHGGANRPTTVLLRKSRPGIGVGRLGLTLDHHLLHFFYRLSSSLQSPHQSLPEFRQMLAYHLAWRKYTGWSNLSTKSCKFPAQCSGSVPERGLLPAIQAAQGFCLAWRVSTWSFRSLAEISGQRPCGATIVRRFDLPQTLVLERRGNRSTAASVVWSI